MTAPMFQPYLTRAFGQQLELEIGPYVSRFEADDNSNTTDNYGLSISGKYTWSQIWEIGGSAQYEHSEIDSAAGHPAARHCLELGT